MAHSALTQILAQLPTLETDELRRLQHIVQERLAPDAPSPAPPDAGETPKRAAFHAALREAGLVSRPPAPRPAKSPARHLMAVQGQPLSETLLAERR